MLTCPACRYENPEDLDQCQVCHASLMQARIMRQVHAWNDEAVQLSAAGEMDRALELLNDAARLAPDLPRTYLNRADVYARMGRAAEAAADRSHAETLHFGGAQPAPDALAGFWQRFFAYLLDSVLLVTGGVIVAVVLGALLAVVMVARGATDQELDRAVERLQTAFQVAHFLTIQAYFWIGNSRGATVGKRALGIRVVSEADGQPIGLARGFGRHIIWNLDWLALGLGWLWCAWDRKKQTWHDKAVGSLVIRTR